MTLLVQHGLMPADETARKALEGLDPTIFADGHWTKHSVPTRSDARYST